MQDLQQWTSEGSQWTRRRVAVRLEDESICLVAMGLGKCVLPMLDWSVACEMILLQNDESLLLRGLYSSTTMPSFVSDLFWVSLPCHRDFIFFPNVVDSKLFLYKLGVSGSWPRVGLVSFSWVFLIDVPWSWRCPPMAFLRIQTREGCIREMWCCDSLYSLLGSSGCWLPKINIDLSPFCGLFIA